MRQIAFLPTTSMASHPIDSNYPRVVASLFSGIGGFELGFEKHGYELRMTCEIDPAARAVLLEHFSHSQIVDDVNSVKRIPKDVELVTMAVNCSSFCPREAVAEQLLTANTGVDSPLLAQMIAQSRPFKLHVSVASSGFDRLRLAAVREALHSEQGSSTARERA